MPRLEMFIARTCSENRRAGAGAPFNSAVPSAGSMAMPPSVVVVRCTDGGPLERVPGGLHSIAHNSSRACCRACSLAMSSDTTAFRVAITAGREAVARAFSVVGGRGLLRKLLLLLLTHTSPQATSLWSAPSPPPSWSS
jgi:hypothetical protein